MDSDAAPIAGPSSASPPVSPPIALSKRTSSKNAIRDTFSDAQAAGSPPSTPPPRRRKTKSKEKEGRSEERRGKREKGKQPLRAHASADDYGSHRHSHGLSWHSTTRDSVVDNLLFSLDNLSRQDVDEDSYKPRESDFDRQKYMFPTYPPLPMTTGRPTGTQRPRGHTYSSSMSSANDRNLLGDSPASYGASTSKGRRSNSSSDFGIKSSIAGMMRPTRNSISGKSTETQKYARKPTLTNGYHTRKHSSNKGSSDFDDGAAFPPTRRNWARRSMSMDQMYAESIAIGASMINRGRPVPSVHSKFETNSDENVAPEPCVAGGPRKKDNPTATGPVYVNQAQPRSSLRKITTQTDLRSASKPLRSPPMPLDVRKQANDFVRANSMRGGPPSDKPLPSPALPSPALKHRDHPGFFKRLFGGGSSRTNSDTGDRIQPVTDKEPPTPPARTSSSNGAPSRSGTRQASKEHPAGTSYPPPTLTKKPSSFFRRRKKSTSETIAPPPLPLGVNSVKAQAQAPEPSPGVSSLRKVMDPYLADELARSSAIPIPKLEDPSRPTTEEESEDSDNLDIFHSGYTPPPDASLGNRNPISRSPSEKPKHSVEQPKHSVEQQQDSPRTKLKVKKRKPDALAPMNGPIFSDKHLSPTSPRFMGTFGRQGSEPVDSAKVSPITAELPIDNKENQRPVSRASTGDRIIASATEIKPENTRKPSVVSSTYSDRGGESWTRPSTHDRPDSNKSDTLYLKPKSSDDVLRMIAGQDLAAVIETSNDGSAPTSAKSPAFRTATSTTFPAGVHSPITPSTRYHSATSLPLPSVLLENEQERSLEASLPSFMVDEGAEYRERARKIFDGDEEDVTKSEAASWLGEKNMLSTKTLQAFMQLFEFSGQNVLAALRFVCGKLVLKGETQQFDRIIMAFSTRWCECNPNHGFKAQDVIHTICYSLVLLNTDLHLADIAERMSRSAYVKNTLPTIRRVVSDAAPNAFDETVKPAPQNARPEMPWSDSTNSVQTLSPNERTSFEKDRPTANKRLSIKPYFDRQNSDTGTPDSAGVAMASNALVNQPWTGPMRSWELEIETILKSFYASIRAEPLPLMGAPLISELPVPERNLVANLGGLKRSNSTVSKAQSDATSFRGLKSMTMGFQSKYNRSRPKLYPSSTISSRTSFDGDSVWSPVQSSTFSKNSFSRTLTSASMQSLGQHLSPTTGDYKHSIGFANALSQAIIREENDFAQAAADNQSASLSVPRGLLEDEALALEGAPWAKEGLVKHKHHLETSGKKAKERTWNEAFAVLSKGKLTLFAFNKSSKSMSMGRKAQTKAQSNGRAASATAAPRGGGDWMENAEQLDVFVLRQTIASTLPPPGYSKTRPYVWALSLPSGAVHLFQVGTPDIAKEFMTTANYWSARLSKEPLSGGVSNIEYGWSDEVINTALLEPRQGAMSPNPPPSIQNRPMHSHTNSSGGMGRSSLQSSIRTSLDTGFGSRPRLPGDKVQLAEWHPPSQSMMASQLMEVDQLKALTAYVSNVEAELARHNELKQGIELAYSPRHANYSRSLANWQRKSDYLLREIVKFQTYADSLTVAQKARENFYSKKIQADGAAKSWSNAAAHGEAELTALPS